jgi:hypothetical protein
VNYFLSYRITFLPIWKKGTESLVFWRDGKIASFWFVPAGDQDRRIEADPREANGIRWFALDDPAEWAHDRFDPPMARFRDKLLARWEHRVLSPQVCLDRDRPAPDGGRGGISR